jgi:anhydro-N-acetylmuramic acid kinase
MNTAHWNCHVLGMMSGTSLDGLDLALCRFEFDGQRWSHSIVAAETVAYSESEKQDFRDAAFLGGAELIRFDAECGRTMGLRARAFLERQSVRPDFIASHGHTLFHQPHNGFTFQAGSGAHLAAAAGLPVVCDFRSLDVALGGQGAPLVPVGDRLLFGAYDFCLNLGGIANISYELGPDRLAFDICPVNMALNHLAGKLGMEYDRNGEAAGRGLINARLLEQLNGIPFYSLDPPKSLGREWFDLQFLPLIHQSDLQPEDLLATCSEHIAVQIARVMTGWNGSVLVTGGGAWNAFLIGRLRKHLGAEIIVPDALTVNFKEALVFAFLGLLRWNSLANTLESVTGASASTSSGVIWMPGAATAP